MLLFLIYMDATDSEDLEEKRQLALQAAKEDESASSQVGPSASEGSRNRLKLTTWTLEGLT